MATFLNDQQDMMQMEEKKEEKQKNDREEHKQLQLDLGKLNKKGSHAENIE